MKNDYQSSKNRKTNMKKDFKQFFIEAAGKSQVKQGEFQQIQDIQSNKQSNKSSDNQFEQVDEEEQHQGGIKSAQFWNGIKMPSNPPKVSKQPVDWQVRCALSTGFNSLGRDNIFYLNKKICKTAGCVLIYDEKIYQKHSRKITTISSNSKRKQILTGTQGSTPQLFLWRYDQQTQSIEWVKRFFVGKKCEDIYAVSFFKQNYIVGVQKFTLHKSSNLHVFDKQSGKKIAKIKVGRFYDLELLVFNYTNDKQSNYEKQNNDDSENQQDKTEERLFYANDEGISQLMIITKNSSNKQIIESKLIYQSKVVTCLCPFYHHHQNHQSVKSNNTQKYNLQILIGDKQGKITAIFNNKCQQQQIKVHNGWIFQIKHKKVNNVNQNYFFSLGAIDSQLAVLSYQNTKFNILHRIHLSGYGRSIQSENDMLLIGKRDGSYEQFNIEQLILQKQTQKITRKQQLSLKCFQSKEKCRTFIINLPDKELLQQGKKVYAYGNSGSKIVRFFTIENGQEGVVMNDLKDYTLRSYPQTLDIFDNLLVYTYDVENKYQEQQTIKSQSFSSSMFSKSKITNNNNNNKKQKQFQKSVLVVEDFQKKQLITKIEIKLQSNKERQKCTVIKFSPSGRYLTMGDNDGGVFLYQFYSRKSVNDNNQKLEQVQQVEFVNSEQKLHKYQIQQLVWSRDQKYIKSVSKSQLYYWQLVKQIVDDNKSKKSKLKIQQCKGLKVRDINWVSMGRFSWEVRDLWQRTSFIQQFNKFWLLQYTGTEVNETSWNKEILTEKKQIILSSAMDGSLRVYNYPACSSRYQQIRVSNQTFQLIEYMSDGDSFSFLVVIQGIIMVIQLSDQDQQ